MIHIGWFTVRLTQRSSSRDTFGLKRRGMLFVLHSALCSSIHVDLYIDDTVCTLLAH